jgi:hypothetical protein
MMIMVTRPTRTIWRRPRPVRLRPRPRDEGRPRLVDRYRDRVGLITFGGSAPPDVSREIVGKAMGGGVPLDDPRAFAPDFDDLFADPDAAIPGVAWWQGPTACPLCGWHGRSVIPIEAGQPGPVMAMECPGCGNRTLQVGE